MVLKLSLSTLDVDVIIRLRSFKWLQLAIGKGVQRTAVRFIQIPILKSYELKILLVDDPKPT
jgi:hypothetical protein